jgi:hypothetical protein
MHDLTGMPLCWHFIGHIQSNKCADIADHFDWVHSVDRLKIAQKLAQAATRAEKTLDILIQVNVQNEPGKSGVLVDGLEPLLEQAATLEGIRIRGLMVIPEPAADFADQRKPFAELRSLMERANRHGHRLDCLSMGMSADLEAAIAEGATHVRVGTALFGPRDYSR